MYQPSIQETHNYFDYTVNKYDRKLYPGHILEKQINHIGLISLPKRDADSLLQCQYCSFTFPSKSQKFRHLGYCNVDIRPTLPKRKLKQLKITNYLEDDSAYQADSEYSSLEMNDFIESPYYQGKLTCQKKIKRTTGHSDDMDTLTQLMKVLSTNKKLGVKSRYNLRKRKTLSSRNKIPKIESKIICKNKKVRSSKVKNEIKIVDILEALSLS